jgi:enamine deaminase RidA (YjgF/YER057c/UK114 family)
MLPARSAGFVGHRATIKRRGTMQKTAINPWQWQDQYGFSQAIEIKGDHRVLYCSGQTSIDASGSVVHAGDIVAQMSLSMNNVERVLTEAGYTLADVVRLNCYTTDTDGFFANYGEVAGRLDRAGVRPAMMVIGVARLAFPDLIVEIEATAVRAPA